MAVFFDVVYKSEEKDRIPSALNNGILTNILPFLKSHKWVFIHISPTFWAPTYHTDLIIRFIWVYKLS